MHVHDVTSRVAQIFQETFPELQGSVLDMERRNEDFEQWDSFAHMDLVAKVEEAFGVRFAIDEVVDLNTPNKFVHAILAKRSA